MTALIRRSRRIRLLRYALYSVSVGLIVATFLPSLRGTDIDLAPFAIFDVTQTKSTTANYPVRILNPRFVGID